MLYLQQQQQQRQLTRLIGVRAEGVAWGCSPAGVWKIYFWVIAKFFGQQPAKKCKNK